MPVALGTQAKLAVVQGATWGTLVSLGTDHRLPFMSCGLDLQVDTVPNDDLSGRSVRQAGTTGNQFVDGPIVLGGDFRQDQHLLLAALFMGAAGTPATVETGVYMHDLHYQPLTQGLFFSAGVDYGGADVYGFASVKTTRRLIQIASGGYLQDTLENLGAGVDKTIASSGWTYATSPTNGGTLRVLHRQMVCRVNAQGGGALGSSDVVYPTLVEIDMNRALELDFGQSASPLEPDPSDFGEVQLRLTFFGMSAALLALFRDSRDSDAALKADIVIQHGTLLGSTEYRHRAYYFPKLKVVECPNSIPGPGRLPMTVTCTAHEAASAPTGFTAGYTEEVIEEWQNEISADPLA